MSKTLEFDTRLLSSGFSREVHEVATFGELPTPDIADEYENITIDGQSIAVSPDIVRSVAIAMSKVRRLIERRLNIMTDCYLFGTLLTGGVVEPDAHHRDGFPYTMQGDYRHVGSVDEVADKTKVLEPTILGYIDEEDGPFEPAHMLVRLDDDLPYYVQKFGSSVLGITDLGTAGEFYDCEFAAPCLNFGLRNAQGDSLLQTSVPDFGLAPACEQATMSLIPNC